MSLTATATETQTPQPAAELVDAVGLARAMAREDAVDRGYDPDETVGEHVSVLAEDAASVTHVFDAKVPGYRGWRWEVTVATAGFEFPVTVSEVLLRPGPGALVAQEWVPWERRVRPGDLGIGDIFPTPEDDDRLAPGYVRSDDPAIEDLAMEVGLGRVRVLSRIGRLQAATRWKDGEFGPRSDMARSAPEPCGTCGFYQQVAGALSGSFGVCCNELAPADGHVVNVGYGCGAHSEIVVESNAAVPVAELVYDDSLLDVEPKEAAVEAPVPAAAPAAAAAPAEAPAPAAAAAPVDATAAPVEDTTAVQAAAQDTAKPTAEPAPPEAVQEPVHDIAAPEPTVDTAEPATDTDATAAPAEDPEPGEPNA